MESDTVFVSDPFHKAGQEFSAFFVNIPKSPIEVEVEVKGAGETGIDIEHYKKHGKAEAEQKAEDGNAQRPFGGGGVVLPFSSRAEDNS